ncbi:hypothetical protein HZS61_010626 [Fusarium oxysporum f. sp. conglutinans]|jgi:ribonuclease HI|uniref:ribonuclease H n=2 Tax=Fusarium oxysporum TaxID=5507 RepID=A0A8H6GWT7_FUSOX|nr:hypothetical protein HZS61_010626 [Fusarium oxysporum f. sp. conglutinans]KAG6997289.1 Ribonuclease H [Fusarium oxysporum f. sp. conglutinans]KAH7463422.1 hypothetical protein FOMA001_g18014 [Fusarium oxysporum f. sp. matthiolae]KAI8412196.1 hypothetical protein FOFC_08826 [Fusarium oxysporum]RKK65385.1 hypothetical protein BFJ69_g16329 [Fusarium oxysporum]
MNKQAMRLRFAATDKILQRGTRDASEAALERFNEMLRQDPTDPLGLRDLIPHVLLRLDREQECYDFIKWWARNGPEARSRSPFLNLHGANAFESLTKLSARVSNLSLSHLVALTLLKLRLYLDCESVYNFQQECILEFFEPDPSFADVDRPIGSLARNKMHSTNFDRAETLISSLRSQYLELCREANAANSYFWEALIDDEPCTPPPHYSPGSRQEAEQVVYQCRSAWQESEDALVMVEADTSSFTRVYEGSTGSRDENPTQSEKPGKMPQQLERKRGTGLAFPSKKNHTTPVARELEEYVPTYVGNTQSVRFVRRTNQSQVLVYTDGACINNGQPDPRAGWSVVFGPTESSNSGSRGFVSGRLEDMGPFGHVSIDTSNRAELRATIAALRLCDWRAEGFDDLLIATDSSYVVEGATGWCKGWVRNGWTLRSGGDVKNKDLWELLLGEVDRWKTQGLRVVLLQIPRDLNTDADAAAKDAARTETAKAEFNDITLSTPQTSTAKTESVPYVLALCLEGESFFDAVCSDLVSHLTSKAKLVKAATPDAALEILGRESPPIILVGDGAITRHKKVWERVIDQLREGATVVAVGCFSSMVNEGEFNRFFAKLGLPWKRGSYHRTDVSLQPGVIDGHLTSQLTRTYSQKALFVSGIERTAAWYTETATSTEAAVAFTKIGSGRLGYIGDVNGEEPSNQVVLAMCGLL